jgi:hypothetical protein
MWRPADRLLNNRSMRLAGGSRRRPGGEGERERTVENLQALIIEAHEDSCVIFNALPEAGFECEIIRIIENIWVAESN